MTADNLTFALEIDFIPDLQEGRDDFKKKMAQEVEQKDLKIKEEVAAL